jgi:hypothetical protein
VLGKARADVFRANPDFDFKGSSQRAGATARSASFARMMSGFHGEAA